MDREEIRANNLWLSHKIEQAEAEVAQTDEEIMKDVERRMGGDDEEEFDSIGLTLGGLALFCLVVVVAFNVAIRIWGK